MNGVIEDTKNELNEGCELSVEKALDRWSKLGFLEGLGGTEGLMANTALSYEKMSRYLIEKDENGDECTKNKYWRELETVIFPVIRRVNKFLNTVIEPEELYDYISKSYERYFDMHNEFLNRFGNDPVKEISKNLKIDIEAEIVYVICNEYIVHLIDTEKYKLAKNK